MDDVRTRLDAVPGGTELRRAAAALAGRVYLVGGAVRDLLLDRPPRELDVVVEGDPMELAHALGGEIQQHERFGTALVTGDGWAVDIARSRRETYARPGALPEVEPAPVAEDLRRRDATINAIAIALDDGSVTAADHALEDLDRGLLRVLHDRSFTDDPSRLWRLSRYRARLGFELEPTTAALAVEAVRAGALGTVSGTRIGNELRLALREPDPVAALRSAVELGLAPWLAPGAEAPLAVDGRADLILLAASLRDPAVLTELGFPAADLAVVEAGVRVRDGAVHPAADRPSAIAAAYRGLPDEAVALAPAEDRAFARRWLDELRDIQLAITGDDLIAAGIPRGPEIGARLRSTLDAVLDGHVPHDRDAQLAHALEGER
ncbi:MAG: CCA tRNA nucleotidyltransferase [Solirubrobacteraceae bacterium]|nr:CCA tRNA nucleotidyltransferase [Solirubrobacteraceae bacterium]